LLGAKQLSTHLVIPLSYSLCAMGNSASSGLPLEGEDAAIQKLAVLC
jgi:hypothetical protein